MTRPGERMALREPRRCRLFGMFGTFLLSIVAIAAWIPGPHALAAHIPVSVSSPQQNPKPDFIRGEIIQRTFDGVGDDLLTAGLGQDGLAGAAPTFTNPISPTALELRRLAIYSNYRALVDVAPGSGYGALYGPSVGAGSGNAGKIGGKEYLAYADDGTGKLNVTLMVQIPAGFNPARACIVTAPSSGSRGVYGAIGPVGEWGLKKGCAVAYTDKGTGTGAHDLSSNGVNLISGERAQADAAGSNANFIAAFDPQYAANNPNRLAFKHAYSQQNPEKDWGLNVLQSIKFAFYVLNLPENIGALQPLAPQNTVVIAAGISNGGGAAIQAAEQDQEGLIDGLAVSEPNVNPRPNPALVIRQGAQRWRLPNHSRPLLDYFSYLNIYAPCAIRATAIVTGPLNLVPANLGENRCAALKARGLVTGDTVEAQATDALARINTYGYPLEANILLPAHHNAAVFEAITLMYANAYGRFSVSDNVCKFSYAYVDSAGKPRAALAPELAALFSVSSGIPPTPATGVQLINDNAQGGPALNRTSASQSGVQDQNLDGALCLRRLFTGVDEQGAPLTGPELAQHQRVKQGIEQIQVTGNLRGLPTIIIHGRSDALVPTNYSSRAYVGLNGLVERGKGNLRYYEILNAQHFDSFLGFPGFNSRYIPIHYYGLQAMDLMYAHLTDGAALPPGQVVPTVPRGANPDGLTAPPLTAANVPPIVGAPTAQNQITFRAAGADGGIGVLQIGPLDRYDSYLPVITGRAR